MLTLLQNGGLWVKDKDMLCAAVKTLDQDVEYVVKYCDISLENALTMASINPARYFGIEDKMMIYPGRKGPLVVFNWENNLKVKKILE